MLEAVSVFYVIVIPSNTTDPFVVVVIGTIFVWFSPRILVSFRSLGIQFFPVPLVVCIKGKDECYNGVRAEMP